MNERDSRMATDSGLLCRAMMTTMHACAGRGDDTRALHLCDLMGPRVVPTIGPSTAKAHCLVLHGGKTSHGRPEIMASIRHVDRSMCAIRARSRYIHQRFTIIQEDFPLPSEANWEPW